MLDVHAIYDFITSSTSDFCYYPPVFVGNPSDYLYFCVYLFLLALQPFWSKPYVVNCLSPHCCKGCMHQSLDINVLGKLKERLARHSDLSDVVLESVLSEHMRFFHVKVLAADSQGDEMCPPPLIDFVWRVHISDECAYKAYSLSLAGTVIPYSLDRSL